MSEQDAQEHLPPGARIYVAGHRGMVGASIVRALQAQGHNELILMSSQELDLRNQAKVNAFMAEQQPEYVFLAAAKVGGILANDSYPADFLHDNLQIQTNVIDAAYRNGTRKLLFLGSSCIYPKLAPQPLKEEYLLTGSLEPTNEWYAIAKIAGIKLCQAYRRQYGFDAIALMPTNLYGPGDNFHPEHSHVLPALIRRFHEAKLAEKPEVVIWGSGQPRREFLHVDDLADASLHLMASYSAEEIVNVGWGRDISIGELAARIGELVGYRGELRFDASKPDGTPRKLLCTGKLSGLGWQAKIDLQDGLASTYAWYQQHAQTARE